MERIHRMADGIGVSLPSVMHKAISKAGRKPRGRPVERKACRIPRTNQIDSAKFHIHKVIRVIASRPDKKNQNMAERLEVFDCEYLMNCGLTFNLTKRNKLSHHGRKW